MLREINGRKEGRKEAAGEEGVSIGWYRRAGRRDDNGMKGRKGLI